jgi:predicted  nucleic acid-binding Zn-ribbon protein
MPGKEQLPDLQQKLKQLNRLEEEGQAIQRAGRSTLDSEALIESLRSNLPLNVLVQHDRLRARGRCSVAEVRRGVCSGCHMSLPVGAVSEIKRQSTLMRCDYCGRFLLLAADESGGTTPGGETVSGRPARRRARTK